MLPKKLRDINISSSMYSALESKAKVMQSSGIKIISLTLENQSFDTKDFLQNSLLVAFKNIEKRKSPVSGLLELRQFISNRLSENDLDYKANNVLVCNSYRHSIFNALQVLLEKGDEVLLPVPCSSGIVELIKLCGGVPVFIDTSENDFKLIPKDLEISITDKTKLLIINTPNNPTGAVYTCKEIEAIAKLITKYNLYILSDERYKNFVYENKKHYSIASMSNFVYERTLIVQNLPYYFEIQSMPISFLIGTENIISKCANFQDYEMMQLSSIVQNAYITLSKSKELANFQKNIVTEFDKKRQATIELLKSIPYISFVIPQGAFFVMINIKNVLGMYTKKRVKLSSAYSIASHILESAKVLTFPGECFGAPNYIRISYTCSIDDLTNGLENIKNFFNTLKNNINPCEENNDDIDKCV